MVQRIDDWIGGGWMRAWVVDGYLSGWGEQMSRAVGGQVGG